MKTNFNLSTNTTFTVGMNIKLDEGKNKESKGETKKNEGYTNNNSLRLFSLFNC